jgi:hypothetical protein
MIDRSGYLRKGGIGKDIVQNRREMAECQGRNESDLHGPIQISQKQKWEGMLLKQSPEMY